MKKPSELLRGLLCDPAGNVSIQGSEEDARLLELYIQMVVELEKQSKG